MCTSTIRTVPSDRTRGTGRDDSPGWSARVLYYVRNDVVILRTRTRYMSYTRIQFPLVTLYLVTFDFSTFALDLHRASTVPWAPPFPLCCVRTYLTVGRDTARLFASSPEISIFKVS